MAAHRVRCLLYVSIFKPHLQDKWSEYREYFAALGFQEIFEELALVAGGGGFISWVFGFYAYDEVRRP